MSDTETREAKITRWLEGERDRARGAMATASEKITASPAKALDGCGAMFEAAAVLEMTEVALADLGAGASADELRKDAADRVIDKARFPPMSTSPTSNLFDVYRAKAWADLAYAIGWRFR